MLQNLFITIGKVNITIVKLKPSVEFISIYIFIYQYYYYFNCYATFVKEFLDQKVKSLI